MDVHLVGKKAKAKNDGFVANNLYNKQYAYYSFCFYLLDMLLFFCALHFTVVFYFFFVGS